MSIIFFVCLDLESTFLRGSRSD